MSIEVSNNLSTNYVCNRSANNNDLNKSEHYIANTSTAFRGGKDTALNISGKIMKFIEDGGFLLLFIIQDFIGMTLPRTIAGFMRDKEVTGEYNIQEGFEVLGREGLTGPCMMAVAPISLYLAAKAGRSTSVNSELIKRFGNSLKEMVSDPNFDKTLLNNPEKFKTEFYKLNIEKILTQSLGKENVTQASVDFVLKQVQNIENIPPDAKLSKFRGKAKYRAERFAEITEYINNIKYKTSSDLNLLEKVRFGSENLKDQKVFKTSNAFDAMIKYSDDAISANKHLSKLDEKMAEMIKNKALGKRVLTTIGMLSATLGVLSVLPKLYARSNVAPGARQNLKQEKNNNDNNNNVSFKGSKGNIVEKIGKAVDKNKNSFITSELEYNGHNFTNTLMAGLSILGLLLPRGMRAYNRAQTDENGKKDLTELWEIITRDLTSSIAVVFAVPMLTRAAVSSYEKNSGFVLMQKDRTPKKWWKNVLDCLNPYSKSHVLSNSELTSLYDNINSKSKMLNFCEYIDKNGGDLQKIISKSENVNELFNKSTLDLNSIKNLSKAEKNKKIILFIENLGGKAKASATSGADEIITKVMKGAASGGKSKITSLARGLNSVPGLLTTFLISPYILGWFIPRLTYKNTRRIHEKQAKEKALNEQALKTSV